MDEWKKEVDKSLKAQSDTITNMETRLAKEILKLKRWRD